MKWFKHYVYFFGTNINRPGEVNYLKIGRTSDWNARYWALNTQTPFKLYVRNVIPFEFLHDASACEAWFHRVYANFRVNGEWFRLNNQVKSELLKDYINARSIFRTRVGK